MSGYSQVGNKSLAQMNRDNARKFAPRDAKITPAQYEAYGAEYGKLERKVLTVSFGEREALEKRLKELARMIEYYEGA